MNCNEEPSYTASYTKPLRQKYQDILKETIYKWVYLK